MGIHANSSNRISKGDLRVSESPGWSIASDRVPAVGDQVRCTAGPAQVTRVLGKTGNGSRLLELTLPDRPRHPFFAESSNVLVSS